MDTGLPPRKPRFDKSWFYIRDCHPVNPAYMGLHLVWGLTGARPRMLNILHMLSNMCVFAYIVYYINTFIYILLLHTGLPPRKPRFNKGWFYLRGRAPVTYTFHGPIST